MKNKFVGKSHDKVVMNALAHAKNMGSRTPIKGPGGVESVFEEDDYVTAFDAGGNVVWSYGNGKWRNKPTGAALEWAKRNFGVNADAGEECCCNSVNPIVQNALEYKRACNASFKVGDKERIVNSCCENAVNLGMVTLKSPEADEVQKLARTKGYAAAKKYCAEKKAEIEKVDGHRAWYFLDAALDAGKMAGMNSCCENAVPVDGSFTPMAYIKGMIKAIEANPSAKEMEGGAWKVVRDKPNYKALASTAEYKKLDKMVGINSCGEEDACCNALKVGDNVTVKGTPAGDITGKIVKKERDGWWWVYQSNYSYGVWPEKDIVKNADCCNAIDMDKLMMHKDLNDFDASVHNFISTLRSWGADSDYAKKVYEIASGVKGAWMMGKRARNSECCNAIANAEDMVCNFDPKTRGAQEVIKAIAAIPGGPSNLKRAQALAIQKRVGASDKDFDAALRFFQWDGIADVANEEAVCNAKFKKGDRVVTVSGVHGEVITVLDGGNYAVQFDGRELSKVPEYRLKAEV